MWQVNQKIEWKKYINAKFNLMLFARTHFNAIVRWENVRTRLHNHTQPCMHNNFCYVIAQWISLVRCMYVSACLCALYLMVVIMIMMMGEWSTIASSIAKVSWSAKKEGHKIKKKNWLKNRSNKRSNVSKFHSKNMADWYLQLRWWS